MYTHYFGLKEKPFSISPDPRYLYMSGQHREALAHLLYGIGSDGCFILLTGDVGTGKTTVSRCILAQLSDSTDVALVVNPCLTVLELLETICDEFEIPKAPGEKSVKFHIDRLNAYLLEAHSQGRNVALLIDEAQNLGLDLLEQLRLLTNLETDRKKLLKIVLLGQTELRQMLNQERAAQISQRVTSRFHLLPLDRDNSFSYIEHRLAVAGTREKVFAKAALARVFALTKGIPRLMNVLCDRALLGAYVEGRYLVSVAIVDAAAREVSGGIGPVQRELGAGRLRVKGVLVALLVLLGVGAASYYLRYRGPSFPLLAPPRLETGIVDAVAQKIMETPLVEGSEKKESKKSTVRIRIVPLEISD